MKIRLVLLSCLLLPTLALAAPLQLADGKVRQVPKDLNLPVDPPKDGNTKTSPPAKDPDANKGKQNNGNNNNSGDKKDGNTKLPDVDDKHCAGSPNCSTTFDGGKKN